MTRRPMTHLLLGTALVLAGCGGAPKGEGANDVTHSSSHIAVRRAAAARLPQGATRRTQDSYRTTPDFGTMIGRRFDDMIPVGARITAINVAIDDGVRAIWFSYEQNGMEGTTPRRGGEGGISQVFKLKNDEKLVAMDGDGRDGIDRLIVVTNKRVKTLGDKGRSNEPTSWLTKQQEQQYVGVGIAGHADDKLRQLSLHFQVRQ